MQTHVSDVIVIGGGVAGLAAAGELTRREFRVTLLEARERLGGRVFTVRRQGWHGPVELGAQFIHGGNDALRRLLRRHRIPVKRVTDIHWYLGPDGLNKVDATRRIAAVTQRIDKTRMRGWSFADFLRRETAEIDDVDRRLAIGFVEGFESAPCDEMSAVAVAGETMEDDDQFTLPAGYDCVVAALKSEINPSLATIHLNSRCSRIIWRPGTVEIAAGGRNVSARAVVVTVPLAVLQAHAGQRGALVFSPRIRAREAMLAKMRMGHVIRMTLRFDQRRWRALLPAGLRGDAKEGFGFVHSSLKNAPVWWSLSRDAVVTGWAGGPGARALSTRPEAKVREAVLADLSRLLGSPVTEVRKALCDWTTHNWSRDPFSRGAYSFTAAGQDGAPRRLREPVRRTIFFAGEATAEGDEAGTVHGALASGLRAAAEVGEALGGK